MKSAAAIGGATGAKALETAGQAGQFLGLASWPDIAAALAAGYTICLWGEWIWRKFMRPALESRGWIKRLRRRAEDERG